MRRTLVVLVALLAACDGGQEGRDGGDGGDGGTILYGPCGFPYSVPLEHTLLDDLGQEVRQRDVHVRCRIQHEEVDAEIFIQAEPVEVHFFDATYEPRRGYVCRDGQVEPLPAGTFHFAWKHHNWKEIEAAFDGRHYVFGFSEMCVGARPCTPWPDQLAVYSHPGGVLLAEEVPATCAGVGERGLPAPFVPLVRVPPGTSESVPFTLGSTEGDPDERPPVTLDLFSARLDAREATWSDFAPFLTDHGNDCDGHPCVDPAGEGFRLEEREGAWRPREGFEDHPVVLITWYGADAYCRWRRMALPDEAHREAAASLLATRIFPWGDEEPTCDLALYEGCQAAGPGPAGSLPAGCTPEGICDLAGNATEWLACGYQEDYYATCGQQSGCTGCPWQETATKVVRGGSYLSPAGSLRAADRDHRDPGQAAPDLGLRCMATNPSF